MTGEPVEPAAIAAEPEPEPFPEGDYDAIVADVRPDCPASMTPAAYAERRVQDALGLGELTDAQAELIRRRIRRRAAAGIPL